MTRPILLDNTVLSNFAVVRRPDLIFTLWGTLACTTTAVLAEYLAASARRQLAPELWQALPTAPLSPAETAFAAQLPENLGLGERTCLAVAQARQGWVATDDYRARQIAQQYQIPVTGTIGALQIALSTGQLSLTTANHLLTQMIAAGYRSPLANLSDL